MRLNFPLIEEPCMPHFYCPQPLTSGAVIDLPEAVAHHVRVVRLDAGAPLTLFDGTGGEYAAALLEVGKRHATALVGAFDAREAELPYHVTVAQALPESTKMDWIIEKAVELGAAAIAPLAARRCVVRLAGERADKRLAHWQAVSVAAAEQCGRNRLPAIAPLMAFNAFNQHSQTLARLLLSPRGTLSLGQWAQQNTPRPLALMVGPEGGFDEEEETAALASGAIAVAMGPRILRTETAALVALATLNALWEGK